MDWGCNGGIDNTPHRSYIGAMVFLRGAIFWHLRCNIFWPRVQVGESICKKMLSWQHIGTLSGVTCVQCFVSEVLHLHTWGASVLTQGASWRISLQKGLSWQHTGPTGLTWVQWVFLGVPLLYTFSALFSNGLETFSIIFLKLLCISQLFRLPYVAKFGHPIHSHLGFSGFALLFLFSLSFFFFCPPGVCPL